MELLGRLDLDGLRGAFEFVGSSSGGGGSMVILGGNEWLA
jgi:hypothetical protein